MSLLSLCSLSISISILFLSLLVFSLWFEQRHVSVNAKIWLGPLTMAGAESWCSKRKRKHALR
uniref:Uncharacterized protein n=1 Tax=Arundo donax TaxID=35708 RepID=A0A0A9ESF8_ARUDO